METREMEHCRDMVPLSRPNKPQRAHSEFYEDHSNRNGINAKEMVIRRRELITAAIENEEEVETYCKRRAGEGCP